MGYCFLYKKGGSIWGRIPETVKTSIGKVITLNDSKEKPLRGLRIFGKTTQNGTPTPEAPVPLVSAGDGGSVGVTVAGKNLFNETLFLNADGWNVENGVYTGQNLALRTYLKNNPLRIFAPNTQYYFSFFVSTNVNNNDRMKISYTDGTHTEIFYNKYRELTFVDCITDAGKTVKNIEIGYGVNGTILSFKEFFIGIYCSGSNSYEPYKGSTLTVSTPNGLPGIPVSSGGNYTDEAGQQWVCDEVDFSRGVYVQRIGKIDSYNGETVGDVFISSTGALTTGATVLYRLAQPVETALSAEELAAYDALHTNDPNTTILNDGGAGMEVKYVSVGG